MLLLQSSSRFLSGLNLLQKMPTKAKPRSKKQSHQSPNILHARFNTCIKKKKNKNKKQKHTDETNRKTHCHSLSFKLLWILKADLGTEITLVPDNLVFIHFITYC